MKIRFLSPVLFLSFSILAMTSCKKEEQAPQGPAGPQEAKFITVKPEQFVVKSSQPGRLEAYRQAEVRARVSGVVKERAYEEGQEVKAGAVLFRIDQAPLQAAYDAAQAALSEGEANLALAQDKKDRYQALITSNAVSLRDMKEAESELLQAAAKIESAKAARESARLRLEYATVTSPIDGRARRAAVTEGALVGEDSATLLTTVEQIDPIYVNFSQPVSDVVSLRRSLAEGNFEGIDPNEVKVGIILGDGSVYSQPGKLIFSDLAVEPSTDSVMMRALVPNPKRELFPGMYVRASFDLAVEKQAILVPRVAVIRTNEGSIVMSINASDEVVALPVEAKNIDGNRWHLTSGLKGGERIIVENPGFFVPGTKVVATEIK
ncbi:efflux RND transporter periplasmic adaptor subunit [Luteolibacter yonseiensis]|uniref:Efflux RND transporter periplasmic adaptor subunit n=1 Tax=Luteolibacter yonseiensis TaxID=1144680 RepID=A0A934R727_9BACT|nr:efflux RND transporter periplasmic adaptor subunit [Luteolibacter yonseiensis]MBK1817547.1 efflux RND transporter periplasmic adaptor subunit [Luteolibacter yonseiensis]